MSEENKEEKVIVEQNGQSTEMDKSKVDEMRNNPDFQVNEKEDGSVNVQEVLYD